MGTTSRTNLLAGLALDQRRQVSFKDHSRGNEELDEVLKSRYDDQGGDGAGAWHPDHRYVPQPGADVLTSDDAHCDVVSSTD